MKAARASIFCSKDYSLKNEHNHLYYKMCAVSFGSFSVFNPEFRPYLFTPAPAFLEALDEYYGHLLKKIGVIILEPPVGFELPPGMSNSARTGPLLTKFNALEGCLLLPEEMVLLLDIDTICWGSCHAIRDCMASNPLSALALKVADEHWQKCITAFYRKFLNDNDLAPLSPIGTEFIGGTREALSTVVQHSKDLFAKLKSAYPRRDLAPDILRDENVFDNDEHILTYVFNQSPVSCINANEFLTRVHTLTHASSSPIESYPILHLLNNKKDLFPALFEELINPSSALWKLSQKIIRRYLDIQYQYFSTSNIEA